MSIKLIALDLDGTALNSEERFSAYTIKTLEKAIKQGVHVVIATGRAKATLPKELYEIEGLQFVVTSNGGATLALPRNEIIKERYITKEAMPAVYKLLSGYDYLIEIFIDGHAYVEKELFENPEKTGIPKRTAEYIKRTRNPQENVLELMIKHSGKIENINICFGNNEDRQRTRVELEKLPSITVTSSMSHNLEIIGEETSKWNAILDIAGQYGIKPEEIMACGDSPNDESMISMAGLGVAMMNGTESTKKIADYITDTNDEDGVAKAIEKWVFGS